ncbi:hypothetical protein JAAARDRAFT_254468 [Jaapia argillacea MUCL 33604]|uniref:Uncharacterized protein n=1 Tax=Jaapia argillacea MUCL 33604 TaxID=933084 RepID=A0A067Q5Y7_9AGAM|nr:hypothetical protein JAAARDRAFT_254468 [Jaapia argillacea MUCL 33604]
MWTPSASTSAHRRPTILFSLLCLFLYPMSANIQTFRKSPGRCNLDGLKATLLIRSLCLVDAELDANCNHPRFELFLSWLGYYIFIPTPDTRKLWLWPNEDLKNLWTYADP